MKRDLKLLDKNLQQGEEPMGGFNRGSEAKDLFFTRELLAKKLEEDKGLGVSSGDNEVLPELGRDLEEEVLRGGEEGRELKVEGSDLLGVGRERG